MRILTAREKNLTTLVIVIGLFSSWWYLNRILTKTTFDMEGQVFEINSRLTASQKALNQLREEIAVDQGKETKQEFTIAQSKITMGLMEDLTIPAEASLVRILSVNHQDGAAFALVVEGQFIEMMRFISFLERTDSRFWVGSIQLGRSGSDTKQPNTGRVRGSIQIAMKG